MKRYFLLCCPRKEQIPNGLLYPLTTFYFTTLDFKTGETVYRIMPGTGIWYNAWGAPIHIHPDGMLYSTALGGLIMIQDLE